MENNIDKLISSFDSTAKVYDQETNTFHHKISEYLTINNMLLELPEDKNIRILDSGGGTGKYSLILNDYGYAPELIDISSKSVAIAKSKAKENGVNLKAIVVSSESTPYEENIFDFIMMNGAVISYTPNPHKLLKESYRILKPNGKLWFDFYNSLGWANEINDKQLKVDLANAEEKLLQMPDWDYPTRVFSLKKMKEMLLNTGFKVKSTYGLILLSNSLSLKERYSKIYDSEILEKYKAAELEISRRKECVGSSWSCCICAKKIKK